MVRQTSELEPMEISNGCPSCWRGEGYDCLAVTANPLAVPKEVRGFDEVIAPRHIDWSLTIGGLADGALGIFPRFSERLRWRMPYPDAQEVVGIVRRSVPEGTRPLFLFVNFLDAHSPYNSPGEIGGARLFSRYLSHRQLTMRWSELPPGKKEYLANLYDGELQWIDRNLVELLVWIEERFGEDSVIIITSDHGEELGEEGRVGHEYGLSQALIHVPLFVRAPGVSAGAIHAPVSLLSLHEFIRLSAMGESPSVETLLTSSPQRLISERYPSGYNVRSLGDDYGRAWVSMIEGGVQAIGPSSYGFELIQLERSGVVEAEELREKLDRYWEEHRDRREGADRPMLSEEELRSLGYVQ